MRILSSVHSLYSKFVISLTLLYSFIPPKIQSRVTRCIKFSFLFSFLSCESVPQFFFSFYNLDVFKEIQAYCFIDCPSVSLCVPSGLDLGSDMPFSVYHSKRNMLSNNTDFGLLVKWCLPDFST